MTYNRRNFLKKAVAGTASAVIVPHIVPNSVFGRPGHPGPNDKISLGFIGLGKRVLGIKNRRDAQGRLNQDDGLLTYFQNEPGCIIRAVCDVDKIKLANGQERVNQFNGNQDCLTFTDFRDMLARPDIDAIVIGTSHNWHGVMTVLGCQSGKDVYVEKPISNTIVEARKMAQAAERYGRVVQCGTQARSSARFKYVTDVIQQGVLGKIKIYVGCGGPPIECTLPAQPVPDYLDWDMFVGPSPWHPYHERLYRGPARYIGFGGSSLTDIGQHFFDVAQWAVEMDDSGPTEIIPADGKDHEFLTLRYANGTEMFWHYKNGRALSSGTFFKGEHGTIDTMAWGDMISFEPEHLANQYFDHAYGDTGNMGPLLGNHASNFLDCIRSRKKPNADINIGVRSVTVAHLTGIAFKLNRPQKWDPVAERFIGDDEANRHLETVHRSPWFI